MIIYCSFATLAILVLGYTTYNLLRKTEKLEDQVNKDQEFKEALTIIINNSDEHLKEIDNKGYFKSDDEVGWFFESIKNIQDLLNNINNAK